MLRSHRGSLAICQVLLILVRTHGSDDPLSLPVNRHSLISMDRRELARTMERRYTYVWHVVVELKMVIDNAVVDVIQLQ